MEPDTRKIILAILLGIVGIWLSIVLIILLVPFITTQPKACLNVPDAGKSVNIFNGTQNNTRKPPVYSSTTESVTVTKFLTTSPTNPPTSSSTASVIVHESTTTSPARNDLQSAENRSEIINSSKTLYDNLPNIVKEKTPSEILGAALLLSMNPSVNPCDDFCGFTGAIKNPTLELINNRISEEARRKLRGIFAEESPADEPKSLTYVKNLYRACMKEDAIEKRNLDGLKEILKLLGGWPPIEGQSWKGEGNTWPELLSKLFRMGFDGFIKTHYSHQTNATTFAHLNGTFSLETDDQWMILQRKLTEMALKMGGEVDWAGYGVKNALEYDQLLTGYLYNEQYQDVDTRPSKDLARLLGISESAVKFLLPLHFNLHRNTSELSEFFETFINHLDCSPILPAFNYLVTRLVTSFILFDSDHLKQQEGCANFVADKFPVAQEILYVRQYISKDTKNQMQGLMQNLNDQMKELCQKINHQIKVKVNCASIDNISMSLGYPNEFYDNKLIEDYYKNLEISTDNFFQGLLNYTRYRSENFQVKKSFDYRQTLAEYISPTDAIFPLHPDDLPNETIYIPAAYLDTYFSNSTPKYMMYGGFLGQLGQMIGMSVPMYIEDQPPINKDRMEVYRALKSVKSSWGTKGAYFLYKNWLKTNGQESPLPGLEKYTSEQMFWIIQSYSKCNNNPNIMPLLKYSDFRRDFECPELQ